MAQETKKTLKFNCNIKKKAVVELIAKKKKCLIKGNLKIFWKNYGDFHIFENYRDFLFIYIYQFS